MSRRPIGPPPESLRQRDPASYDRALFRALDRQNRRYSLDKARLNAKDAGYGTLAKYRAADGAPRPVKAAPEPARRRLVVPTVLRLPSLEDRGYFRTLTGGWRFFPSRSDLPGGAR